MPKVSKQVRKRWRSKKGSSIIILRVDKQQPLGWWTGLQVPRILRNKVCKLRRHRGWQSRLHGIKSVLVEQTRNIFLNYLLCSQTHSFLSGKLIYHLLRFLNIFANILVHKSQQDAHVTEFIFVWELLYMFRVGTDGVGTDCGRVGTDVSVLWMAYATHNTLKSVPTLPR